MESALGVYRVVDPINQQPLTNEGLDHVAAIPDIAKVRFVARAIDDEGLSHFIDAANANSRRPQWLGLYRVDVTGREY